MKKAKLAENSVTTKFMPVKRQSMEAVEVKKELEYCHSRIIYNDVAEIERRIENGEIELTNDLALKKDFIELSEIKTTLHAENWECMLNEAARVTKFIPREERRLLNEIEVSQYQGAIFTLHWLLGHHDGELAGEDLLTNNLRYVKNKAGPVIYPNKKKIEQQQHTLLMFEAYKFFIEIKSDIEDGLAEISSDPSLQEELVRRFDHTTLVHAEYWEWVTHLAEIAERYLPKEICHKITQTQRVFGALCALKWFLSGENSRLATYLNFTIKDDTSEKIM